MLLAFWLRMWASFGMGWFSARCDICGNVLRRNSYAWQLPGRFVSVCSACNGRLQREASKQVFQSGQLYVDQQRSKMGCLGELGLFARKVIFVLGLLILLGVLAGISNLSRTTPAARTADLSISTPSSTPSFADQVKSSQQRAMQKYPELAKGGSAFNQYFLREYERQRIASSAKLSKPDWPLWLADECAARIRDSKLPAIPIEIPAVQHLADNTPPVSIPAIVSTPGNINPHIFIGWTKTQIIQRFGLPSDVTRENSPDGPFEMLIYDRSNEHSTFFTIFASDSKVSSGYYNGTAFY